jgi:phosphoribulokinase
MKGSTIDWIPCGRKLTCSYPGLRMHYGPDSYFGNEVSVLEIDGQFDRLEELIYVESHLSNTSTKYYGEMTELLLKHREYPGSNNGSGLFQVLVGLKMRLWRVARSPRLSPPPLSRGAGRVVLC